MGFSRIGLENLLQMRGRGRKERIGSGVSGKSKEESYRMSQKKAMCWWKGSLIYPIMVMKIILEKRFK